MIIWWERARTLQSLIAFMLIGSAIVVGISVVWAQAELNRQAELYVKRLETQRTAAASRTAITASTDSRSAGELPQSTIGEARWPTDASMPGELAEVRDTIEGVSTGAFASIQPDDRSRTSGPPEPRQPVTPGAVLAETAPRRDRFTSVRVTRTGVGISIYRVPREIVRQTRMRRTMPGG